MLVIWFSNPVDEAEFRGGKSNRKSGGEPETNKIGVRAEATDPVLFAGELGSRRRFLRKGEGTR